MAQAYHAPEMDLAGPVENAPVDLMADTNGYLYVKMFTTDQSVIPRHFPAEARRTTTFPVVQGKRQDDGTKAFERDDVSAELLRTGIANANGHAWALINAGWWEQPITNPKLRAKLGVNKQFVIKLVYCAHPTVEAGKDPVMVLGRQTLDDIRILARSHTWKAHVWKNHGGPLTINLTSPKAVETVPAKGKIVVRKGCIDIVPV
jgi:hypothetical protein